MCAVGVPIENLQGGKLAIYELMAEESAVNYWEKYGNVSLFLFLFVASALYCDVASDLSRDLSSPSQAVADLSRLTTDRFRCRTKSSSHLLRSHQSIHPLSLPETKTKSTLERCFEFDSSEEEGTGRSDGFGSVQLYDQEGLLWYTIDDSRELPFTVDRRHS